jgi:hypothetical protein
MREPRSVEPSPQAMKRRDRKVAIAAVLVFLVPVLFVARGIAVGASPELRNLENRTFNPESYVHDLTAEQRATIRKVLDEAQARAAEARTGWHAAIAAAIAERVAERPDLGPCPISVPLPARLSTEAPSLPSWLTVARAPVDVAAVEPARWSSQQRAASELEKRATEQSTDREAERLMQEVQAFGKADVWTWDVLMIVVKRVDGSDARKEGDFFISGEVDGSAYLYDYRSRAITCAGRVHAKNSNKVEFMSEGGRSFGKRGIQDVPARRRAIDNDLTQESYAAAAEALRFRAGPPLPEEP